MDIQSAEFALREINSAALKPDCSAEAARNKCAHTYLARKAARCQFRFCKTARCAASYIGKHQSNIVTDVPRDRVHPPGIVINASRKRAARNLRNPLIPIGAFQTAYLEKFS